MAGAGDEREAARSLKRHLNDKAGIILVDSVRVFRELSKSGGVEARPTAH